MAKKQQSDDFVAAIHSDLDRKLAEIRDRTAVLDMIQSNLNQEMEAVRVKYQQQMDQALQALTAAQAELKAIAKAAGKWLFAESERVSLANGLVLLKVQMVVNRGRVVLQAIEDAGRSDLLKIAKSVDWDKLEKLADDELEYFGTYRKRKAEIAYELAG